MSTVTIVDAGATQVVRVQDDTPAVVRIQAEGPQGAPGPLGPWITAFWIDGKPGPGERLFQAVLGEELVFGADLDGWVVVSRIEPTSETVWRVLIGDVQVATLTWGPSSVEPVFATVDGEPFTLPATGDFAIVAANPADDTHADISVRMRAIRP